MKLWLQDNDIKMYSTHDKAKPLVTERYYKYISSISTNVYNDKLDDIVNTIIHNIIEMKPVDPTSSTYIDFKRKIRKFLNLKLVTM